MTCGQYFEATDIVGFLDKNYDYKSGVAQIPNNAELAPIGHKILLQRGIELMPHPIVRVQSSIT